MPLGCQQCSGEWVVVNHRWWCTIRLANLFRQGRHNASFKGSAQCCGRWYVAVLMDPSCTHGRIGQEVSDGGWRMSGRGAFNCADGGGGGRGGRRRTRSLAALQTGEVGGSSEEEEEGPWDQQGASSDLEDTEAEEEDTGIGSDLSDSASEQQRRRRPASPATARQVGTFCLLH